MNYNKVLNTGKKEIGVFKSPAITRTQVLGIWRVVQDLNTPSEPTLAIKSKRNQRFI